MILTDYYEFVHLPDCASPTRRDCTASTQNYNEFEVLRNKHGELFIHFGFAPPHFGGDVQRKTDKAITKGKNISRVYVPDITLPFAYGDFKGTTDALLMVIAPDESELEIFVARGQKSHRLNLWQMLSGGEFDAEMAALRARAVPNR